jgi:hypothetical protein
MTTYAKAECSICHAILPKPQLIKHESISIVPGQRTTYFRASRGGPPREIGYSRGEGRLKLSTVWVCQSCEPLYKRRAWFEWYLIAIIVGAVALGFLIVSLR